MKNYKPVLSLTPLPLYLPGSRFCYLKEVDLHRKISRSALGIRITCRQRGTSMDWCRICFNLTIRLLASDFYEVLVDESKR